jgi:hypothetical protein
MAEKIRSDMRYYDYLYSIQIISQKLNAIQQRVITQVFENYDVCRVINKLDRQIEHIDGLLSI